VRVLFTGGAGYVGSFPAPFLLGAGHKVRVLDDGESLLGVWANPDFEFVHGNIRHGESVAKLWPIVRQ
jgi:nucleoside-diphosphate-sugar epimerase